MYVGLIQIQLLSLYNMQDKGKTMQTGDGVMTVHGAALCMFGDTPASNFIAGFKGVGFSLQKCRRRMVTAKDV